MSTTNLDPITTEWTTKTNSPQLVHDVVASLAHIPTTRIPRDLLAAAATEAALDVGITWSFNVEDAPALSVRLLTKVATMTPNAGGPACQLLLDHLRHIP